MGKYKLDFLVGHFSTTVMQVNRTREGSKGIEVIPQASGAARNKILISWFPAHYRIVWTISTQSKTLWPCPDEHLQHHVLHVQLSSVLLPCTQKQVEWPTPQQHAWPQARAWLVRATLCCWPGSAWQEQCRAAPGGSQDHK